VNIYFSITGSPNIVRTQSLSLQPVVFSGVVQIKLCDLHLWRMKTWQEHVSQQALNTQIELHSYFMPALIVKAKPHLQVPQCARSPQAVMRIMASHVMGCQACSCCCLSWGGIHALLTCKSLLNALICTWVGEGGITGSCVGRGLKIIRIQVCCMVSNGRADHGGARSIFRPTAVVVTQLQKADASQSSERTLLRSRQIPL